MGTISEDVSNINGLVGTLVAAANAYGQSGPIAAATALASAWSAIAANPTGVTQAIADDMGAKVRAADQTTLDSDYNDAALAVHNALSQAMVDHYPALDWYQAAATPQSGGKHKPGV